MILIDLNYNGWKAFAVDINGNKNPNKWGYDVFAIRTATKSSSDDSFFFVGNSSMVQKGGTDINKIITNRD